MATPVIHSITASSGYGGQNVNIHGAQLTGTITAITFDGVHSRFWTTGGSTATKIKTVLVPPHAPGPVTVVVHTTHGTGTKATAFTYTTAPTPTITAVTPRATSTAGGGTVTIQGHHLTNITSITIGGNLVTLTTWRLGTEPTFVQGPAPAHAPGPVTVTVTTTHGTATAELFYSGGVHRLALYVTKTLGGTATHTAHLTPTPTTTPTPTHEGRSAMPHSGTHWWEVGLGSTASFIGSVPQTGATGYGARRFGGSLSGQHVPAGRWSFFCRQKAASAVTVTTQFVRIYRHTTGLNIYNQVGPDLPLSTFTIGTTFTDYEFTATLPEFNFGPTEQLVINLNGEGTSAGTTITIPVGGAYAVLTMPEPRPLCTITGLTPTTGTILGGTHVVITGTHFTTVTSVRFGTVTAASYTVTSPTRITAVTPPHASGSYHVTVTTAAGPTTSSAYFAFVLEDWQFEINGLVLGADTNYTVVAPVDGLDLPPVRTGDVGQPRMHGQLAGLDLLGGRDITMPLQVVSDPDTTTPLQEVLDTLFTAVDMRDVYGRPQVQEVPLFFKLPNEPVRHANVRIRGRKMPIDIAYSVGDMASVLLAFHATDPRLYGATETASRLLTGDLTMNNAGNFATAPTITFLGTCSNPFVVLNPGGDGLFRFTVPGWGTLTGPGVLSPGPLPAGPFLAFDLTVGTGETLVIDIAAHTATLDGVNVLNTVVPGSWWWWLPPGTTTAAFGGGTLNTYSAVTVEWNPAWV